MRFLFIITQKTKSLGCFDTEAFLLKLTSLIATHNSFRCFLFNAVICVSTECHDLSLTDCTESQLLFMNEVGMPNFRTYWQMLFSLSDDEQIKSLRAVRESGMLTNIHVYQYKVTEDSRERKLLLDGFDVWSKLFSLFEGDETERFAMLEFVGGYPEESFFEDSATLIKLADISNA